MFFLKFKVVSLIKGYWDLWVLLDLKSMRIMLLQLPGFYLSVSGFGLIMGSLREGGSKRGI